MKVRKGYYSESLLYLPGRLHVSNHGASIELSFKDKNNKRHLLSIPGSDIEGLAAKLWSDWQSVESSENPAIDLIEGYYPIRDKDQLFCICEELRYISDRATKITSLLFNENSVQELSVVAEFPEEHPTSINLEKKSSQEPSIADSKSISDIVDSLQASASEKEDNALSKYIGIFSNLKFDSLNPYAGMGKAILLLSVINLASANIMKSTKVPIGKDLEQTYSMLWKQYVSSNVHNIYSSYEQSFIEMSEESFWRLSTNKDFENDAPSPLSAYKCAVIEQDLFDIIKDGSQNISLKSVLIDSYL